MNTLDQTCRDRLHEWLVEDLWSQWTALGAAGLPTRELESFIIDPEALLLATLKFGAVEPRLAGEVADWLEKNGDVLSLQRMRNLQAAWQIAPRNELNGFAEFMIGAGFRHWRAMIGDAGESCPFVPQGFRARGLAQSPDPDKPCNLVMRLRRIFGLNARPEIMAWLWTHRAGHPARIARETGWFSKSVQAILDDMETAGCVTSCTRGKCREFSFHARNQIFHPELGIGAVWQSQGPRWSAFKLIDEHLEDITKPDDYRIETRAIALRGRLASLHDAFHAAEMVDPFAGIEKERGAALVEAFCATVESMVARGNQR